MMPTISMVIVMPVVVVVVVVVVAVAAAVVVMDYTEHVSLGVRFGWGGGQLESRPDY
jgi:hypothetical protein